MKVFAILMLVFCGANADKVIGGTAASDGQFPSIVFQEKSGSFFCGGTIIAANRVLTAAHCEQNLIGLTVTGGTNSRSSGGSTISVSAKVVHPQYNSQTTQNDVQILKLALDRVISDGAITLFSCFGYYGTSTSSDFVRVQNFGSNIAAATLASTTPAASTGMIVAGWGDTNPGILQSLPTDLEYTDQVAVISTSDCNARLAYNGAVLDGMMCIGTMDGGYDTCQGDSGGPAYIGTSNIVAGITSWGYGCAQPNNPGVYTDVAYYNSWITTNADM